MEEVAVRGLKSIAWLLGVMPAHIRYLERTGRVPKPRRNETGERVYNIEEMRQLRAVIKVRKMAKMQF